MAALTDAQLAVPALQIPEDLAILRLTGPIFAAQQLGHQSQRTSNASQISNPSNDPSIVKADLQHYRDLFSKLRFSYVEQVTKEKFLRAVTSEPAVLVQHGENVRLGRGNEESKRLLAEKKEELHGMLSDLEAQSRELARRYNNIQLQTTQLQAISIETEELHAKIASLNATQPQSTNPEQRLPLQETLAILAERERESLAIDSRMSSLKNLLPQKDREVNSVEEELGQLERRKQTAHEILMQAGAEQQNGKVTDAELHLRWLKGVEAGMRAMLDT